MGSFGRQWFSVVLCLPVLLLYYYIPKIDCKNNTCSYETKHFSFSSNMNGVPNIAIKIRCD